MKAVSFGYSKCTFFTIFFLFLSQQCALVPGDKMVSTSTPTPDGLTTPRQSAENKAKLKSELTDFVSLAATMKGLKLVKDLLTNTTLLKKMEDELTTLQHIIHVSAQYYNFQRAKDFSTACSFAYEKRKRFLLREFEILLNECKVTLENVDVLHLSTIELAEKTMLHACSERTKTLPVDVATLVDNIFQLSYICTIEHVKQVLQEMKVTQFFSFIDENSKLTIQEIDYLLRTYQENVQTRTSNDNFTGTFDMEVLAREKMKLEKIKKVTETKIMERSIRNFTDAVEVVLAHDREKRKTVFHDSNRNIESYLHQFGSTMCQGIYETHLKIPTIDLEDSIEDIEDWSTTPGVYKVMLLNRLLNEMLARVVLLHHNRFKLTSGVQKDKKGTGELYTEISPTYGRRCVNSPIHLAGTCTMENHEVCREVLVNLGMRYDKALLGAQDASHLRSFPQLKHCSCGFLTGCEKFMNSYSEVCFLVADAVGRCRGGEGYPCKTHPLEPGQYDESCASRYCNWKRNACENGSARNADAMEKVQRFGNKVKNTLKGLMK